MSLSMIAYPMGWLFVAVVLIALMPLGAGSVAAEEQPYTVLQRTEDRLIVELPNRFIIIAQEMRAAPVVSAQVWVKTGSIYEQEHVGAGLSHFLEHLLAGGSTENRSEQETNALLGHIGAQTNAFTSLDAVAYYINAGSDHAPLAIELLSDWMQNSTIPQDQYERERDVIQREFEFGSGDSRRILWKLTQMARYRAHPARHPTIGYLDEFLTVTRDEIYEFYRRMYVPNNMLFVVTGDIDKQQTVAQIAELWAHVPTGELPALRFPVERELDEPRFVEGRAAIERPRVRLAWPTVKLAEPGDYALDVLATILGQGESSRLNRHVRDQQQRVNTIVSYHSSADWGEGFFGIDFEVATDSRDEIEQDRAIQRALAAVMEQIKQVREEGITEDELARAKRQTQVGVVLAAQTAQGMANRLARDIISTADPDYLRRYTQAVDQITVAEVREVARRFLEEERQIMVTLLPADAEHAPTDVRRPTDEVDADGLAHEPVDLDNRPLLARMREAVSRAAQVREPVIVEEPVRYLLPNGLRLIVGRDTSLPAVAMHLYQLGGLLTDEPGREGVAGAVAAMQLRGTTTRSAEALAREIEDLGATLTTEAGYNTSFAQATALSEDWQALMHLLADVTLRPSFPAEEWRIMQPRLLAAIDRQKDSWHGEATLRLRGAYYGNHPWATTPLGRAEVVAALTAEDLAAFHERHLIASNTVISVFGDVDSEEVHEQVVALFGKMPASGAPSATLPMPAAPQPDIISESSTKPLAAVVVGFGPAAERSHPDYPALAVLASVMSSFPSGWLEEQLRGQGPGLVYAVHAAPSTGLVPGHFMVLFNTNPATAPEALRRAMSVVHRAREEQASEADLARAKTAVLTRESLGRQTISQRATNAALAVMYGLGDDADERFEAAVQAVDARTLRAVARTYLRNPLLVVLSRDPVPAEALRDIMEEEAATP